MNDIGKGRFQKEVRRDKWRGGGLGHRLLVSFLGSLCALLLVGILCLFFMSVTYALGVAVLAALLVAVGGAVLEPIGMIAEALAAVLGAIADIFSGL